MEGVTVPTMMLVGSSDFNSKTVIPGYEHLGSLQKGLVVIESAGHLVFHNPCRAGSWLSDPEWCSYCSDPIWDMDRAHDLINHFTTAFLPATLKGDLDAAAALAPDAVSFPGITYVEQGF